MMSKEERRRANQVSTIKNRERLRALAARAGYASAQWFYEQPPEVRAFIVNRMLVAKIRDAAARRGLPQPILYERDPYPNETGDLVVDIEKIDPSVNPDPRLYRALPGGGYTSREAEAQWNRNLSPEHAAEARRYRRNARRRARRAERKAAEAAQPGPIDITPPKKPDE
jgi:hypothetical protein